MKNKLANAISSAVSISPAVIKTTTTGTAVDLAGYESAAVVIVAGTVTDGTHTLKLTECDTSAGSYTDVDSGDLQGSFTALTDATTAGTTQEVGYGGSKRYLKVVSTVTGSPATGGAYAALVVRGDPKTNPAT